MPPPQAPGALSRRARELMRLLAQDGMRQYNGTERNLDEVTALLFIEDEDDLAKVPMIVQELIDDGVVDGDEMAYVFTERGVRRALDEADAYVEWAAAAALRLNPYGPSDDEFPFPVANPKKTEWNLGGEFMKRKNRLKDGKFAELATARMAAVLDDPEEKGREQRGGRHGLRKLDFQGTKYRLGWCVNTDDSVTFVFLLHREDEEYNATNITSPCC